MRGIILSPGYAGFMFNQNSIERFTRHSLAYFDKISMPPAIAAPREKKAEIISALTALGVYHEIIPERTATTFPDDMLNDRKRVRDFWSDRTFAGERWVVSMIFREGALPALDELFDVDKVDRRRSIAFAISGALPSPPEDVPYESIVDFRMRRKDEVEELSHVLERVAVKYSGAVHLEEAIEAATADITSAINNANAVMSERWPNRQLFDYAIDFVGAAATGAYEFDGSVSSFLKGATIGGGGTVTIKCAAKVILGSPDMPTELKPFAYAASLTAIR